jgi:hypothetical protein
MYLHRRSPPPIWGKGKMPEIWVFGRFAAQNTQISGFTPLLAPL